MVDVPVPGTFGGTRQETRVLRGDGSAVSVGEGLADAGSDALITAHVPPPPQEPLGPGSIVEHVVVISGGVALIGGAFAVGLLGVAFAGLALSGASPPDMGVVRYDFDLWRTQGVALMATALLLAGVGVATAAATAVHWALSIRAARSPAPAAALEPLKTVFGWEMTEAQEVVRRHNELTVKTSR